MKTYLSLQLDEVSKRRLGDFVSRYIPLTKSVSPSSYHLTVIYSFAPIEGIEQFSNREISESVYAKRYRFFRSRKHGKILVLVLEFPEVTRFHNYLKELRAEVNIPKFIPHITLAYDVNEKLRLKNLPLPNFPLTFDRIFLREK